MVDDCRQARTRYRGVDLPPEMTPQCLDELSRLFSDFEWDRLQVESGELAFAKNAAVMAFEIVSKHLAQKHQALRQQGAYKQR